MAHRFSHRFLTVFLFGAVAECNDVSAHVDQIRMAEQCTQLNA
jgi:hypothetical protein